MNKILITILLVVSMLVAADVYGNPGPLTNGYYYKASLTGQDGRHYINYYRVNNLGEIQVCLYNGRLKEGYYDKHTSESANGRMATLTWYKSNGTWTETQTVHFMRDNNDGTREIDVWRSVTNKPGDAWSTYYYGTIQSMGTYK